MIRKILLSIAVAIMSIAQQQAQEKPVNRAAEAMYNSTEPLVHQITALSLPDLTITECGLVSVAPDANQKFIYIQVSIKVKNIGSVKAGPSTLVAYYRNPGGGTPTKEADGSISMGIIKPGQYFSKIHSFRAPAEFLKPGVRFEFWVKTDAKNEVGESREENNISEKMIITTPNW